MCYKSKIYRKDLGVLGRLFIVSIINLAIATYGLSQVGNFRRIFSSLGSVATAPIAFVVWITFKYMWVCNLEIDF